MQTIEGIFRDHKSIFIAVFTWVLEVPIRTFFGFV